MSNVTVFLVLHIYKHILLSTWACFFLSFLYIFLFSFIFSDILRVTGESSCFFSTALETNSHISTAFSLCLCFVYILCSYTENPMLHSYVVESIAKTCVTEVYTGLTLVFTWYLWVYELWRSHSTSPTLILTTCLALWACGSRLLCNNTFIFY